MAGELEIELPNRNLTVQLRYQGESTLGSKTGFWVRGCPAARCLDLLMAADAFAGGEVRYYLLPAGRDDKAAGTDIYGLVGLPIENILMHRMGLGIPLIAGTAFAASQQILWRPAHCSFDPEPTAEQWLAHLPGASARALPAAGDYTEKARASGMADAWVWLPRIGLVLLEPADRVTVADVLKLPASCHRVQGWQTPPQPAVLPERLAGFALWPTSSSEEALSDLASDFGQQAGDLDQAKIKGQPEPSTFESLSSRGQAWVLKKLENWFGDRSGSEKQQPSGKSKLGKTSKKPSRALTGQVEGNQQGRIQGLSWALYRRLSQAIEGQRAKQLRKLLEMTKVDPDEALKYAIPLAGESAFRGLAVPGARLQARLPNYSANSADSSGPADFWGMDHDLQRELRASYLKMANREVAAGRFRRAAYIYANLLADQAGAAGVLEQGGFYREAAMIYGDKLGREADQARCLLAAGLHEQAVEIFLSKNDYLSAAEAWLSAGREEDARREFQRAVQKLVVEQKMLQAAKVLDEKLQLREEAQDLLWAQWPNGAEPLVAASTFFHMLAERPEVAKAHQRLQAAVDLAGTKYLVELSVLCQSIATSYPDRTVQSAARDACRVAVATGAREFSAIEMTRALGALQHLDPTDGLLARDAARFKLKWDKTHTQGHSEIRKPNAAQSSSISRLPPLLLAETDCIAFQCVGDSLVVVSQRDNLLHVTRYLTPDVFPSSVARGGVAAMRGAPATDLRQYVVDELSAVRGRASQQQYSCEWWPLRAILSDSGPNACQLVLWLDAKKEPTTANKVLYEADAQPQALAISTNIPACLELCMAIFRRDRDTWAGLSNDGGDWKLSTCQGNSQNLRSYLLDEPEAPAYELDLLADRPISIPQHTACLGSLDNTLVAAFGNQIVVGAETTTPWTAQVTGQISGISLSPANTRKRIAVAHSGGLDAFWPGSLEAHQLTLSREGFFQHALWMQGGRLFAVSDDTLYRYHIRGTQVVSEASIPLLSPEIVGLLELSAGVCGVCYRSGIVDRF